MTSSVMFGLDIASRLPANTAILTKRAHQVLSPKELKSVQVSRYDELVRVNFSLGKGCSIFDRRNRARGLVISGNGT